MMIIDARNKIYERRQLVVLQRLMSNADIDPDMLIKNNHGQWTLNNDVILGEDFFEATANFILVYGK